MKTSTNALTFAAMATLLALPLAAQADDDDGPSPGGFEFDEDVAEGTPRPTRISRARTAFRSSEGPSTMSRRLPLPCGTI